MDVPLIGAVTKDIELDWLCSDPIPLPLLGGASCVFVLEAYEDDPGQQDFHDAIAALLSLEAAAMKTVEPYVYQYFVDFITLADEHDFPIDSKCRQVKSAGEVWGLVDLRHEVVVSRRPYGECGVYISIEGRCLWEIEHGIQIVFRAGSAVSKVGPYDGHLTHADAFGDPSLEGVIYRSVC